MPDHSYTEERMEEIRSKTVENSAKQETTLIVSPVQGGSSDTKEIIDSGESGKNGQSQRLEDVGSGL